MKQALSIESPQYSALEQQLERLRDRREFLKFIGRSMGYGALATLLPACGGSGDDDETDAPAIPTPPRAYTVLKRTSFGAHRDEMTRIGNLGIDAYLEWQLDHQAIDDGSLEADIAARFPLTTQTPQQLLAGFPDNIYEVAVQMIGAAHFRQMFSKRQLFEVMVEFWSNHFNIHLVNGLCPTLKPQDDQAVIRAHALGNFRDLLRASARSPAMLFYLDNFFNQATAPNENYARELMELHTLGVDGGYDEQDVKEVARAFTGWTLRFPDDEDGDFGEFVFVDAIHDKDSKQVLGQPIAADGGLDDGEQVLDLLAGHPSTARFIATKLCRRFISDRPSTAAIDAVGRAFLDSDGDIQATLRALFATPAFRSSADLKFTRPAEFLPALVRALGPDAPYPADDGLFLFYAQSVLGQLPYYWPTPDGYPDTQDYWASTGGWLNRWRLSFLSYSGLIPGVDVIAIDYAAMLGSADRLEAVLDAITDAVLMRPLSATDRALIVDWLRQEFSISDGQILSAAEALQLSALIAAVLVSSVYFNLR